MAEMNVSDCWRHYAEHCLWTFDVRRFLCVTLAHEVLSSSAENERKELLQQFPSMETPLPSAYLDMKISTKSFNAERDHSIHEFYEAFDHEENSGRVFEANYYNLSDSLLDFSQNIDNDNYVVQNSHRNSLNLVPCSDLTVSPDKPKITACTDLTVSPDKPKITACTDFTVSPEKPKITACTDFTVSPEKPKITACTDFTVSPDKPKFTACSDFTVSPEKPKFTACSDFTVSPDRQKITDTLNKLYSNIESSQKKFPGNGSLTSSTKSASISSSTSTLPTESESEKILANSEVLTISASALKYSAIKYGVLSRKERRLKAFDVTKKYWVGALGRTIYIYTSEKDSKPQTVIDIVGYSARQVSFKDINSNTHSKKDFIFEIVNPGKKTYQFITNSKIEMESWISIITQLGRQPKPLACISTPQISDSCLPNERSLPKLPVLISGMDQIYDEPDSQVRPVEQFNEETIPPHLQQYEFMGDNSFYHYIDHETFEENLKNMTQSCTCEQSQNYYNSVDQEESTKVCSVCENKNSMYYNLMNSPCSIQNKNNDQTHCFSPPTSSIEEEAIYDIILDGHRQQFNGLTERDKLMNGIINLSKGGVKEVSKSNEESSERQEESSCVEIEPDLSSKENTNSDVERNGLGLVNQFGPNRIQDIINRIEMAYSNSKKDSVPINKRNSKINFTTLSKKSTLSNSSKFKSSDAIFGSQRNSSVITQD